MLDAVLDKPAVVVHEAQGDAAVATILSCRQSSARQAASSRCGQQSQTSTAWHATRSNHGVEPRKRA